MSGPVTPSASSAASEDTEAIMKDLRKFVIDHVSNQIGSEVPRLLGPVHREIKNIKATVHDQGNAIEHQKHCIASLEMIQCDKTLLIKGIPMFKKQHKETMEDTRKALMPFWDVVGLDSNNDIHIESVARLGAIRSDGSPNFIPHIRITFASPRDKTEVTKKVHLLSECEESRKWSCVTELPRAVNNETATARCVAYYIRKQWKGCKTTIRYQSRTAKVSYKDKGATQWVQVNDKDFKAYLADFHKMGGYPHQPEKNKGTQGKKGKSNANNEPLGTPSQAGAGMNREETPSSSSEKPSFIKPSRFEPPPFDRSSRSQSQRSSASQSREPSQNRK